MPEKNNQTNQEKEIGEAPRMPVWIDYHDKPQLENGLLIEGLPGVGNIGKFAADYLVEKLKPKKCADIYSQFFPPQVMLDGKGIITQVKNELYYYKREEGRDLLFLVGDNQAITPEGQYIVVDRILKAAKSLGVNEIITLGGYGLGHPVENPKVLGAATHLDLTERPKQLGVVFGEGEEPTSGIVGASGLLLGMGQLYGMRGICLMGQTSGFTMDLRSSREVLKVLTALLEVEIDLSDFGKNADTKLQEFLEKLRQPPPETGKREEDIHYIA